jgi:trehalose 6-phosphate phosphatase
MADAPLPEPDLSWALFLDVDGTLLEIAPGPDEVVVAPGLAGLLAAVAGRLGGALALVSGRSIARLDELFTPLRLPAAGLHGRERRRADGRTLRAAAAPRALAAARAAFTAFAHDHPGALVEDKGPGVALHWRRAPRAEEAARALAERVARDLGPGFRALHGRRVAEVLPAGGDKGAALAAVMQEPPFAGRIPVFVGDDSTDEDGFAAANRLGGLSIRVGDGARPTAARARAAGVAALRAWLARLAGDTT